MMPQIALFSAALSVLNNALTNEVRIEESWLVFSLRYNRTAYFFSDNRGAAAEENPRIGYLAVNSSSVERHLVEAFQQGLRGLGWIEGRNSHD